MEWTEIIVAIISATATITCTLFGKLAMDRRKAAKKDPIMQDVENNENIEICLSYILDQMGADRAYIMQFHNGGYYISGKSQQKFSCSHEISSPGTSRECHDSQNHLISNYHNYISSIMNNQEYCYEDTKDIDDHAFKNVIMTKGVLSIYNIPLKTLEGKIIGILGIDFVKNQATPIYKFSTDSQECKTHEDVNQFMRRQARILSAYLI
jgi:hypothetical protein